MQLCVLEQSKFDMPFCCEPKISSHELLHAFKKLVLEESEHWIVEHEKTVLVPYTVSGSSKCASIWWLILCGVVGEVAIFITLITSRFAVIIFPSFLVTSSIATPSWIIALLIGGYKGVATQDGSSGCTMLKIWRLFGL